jgi:hypothetical protein
MKCRGQNRLGIMFSMTGDGSNREQYPIIEEKALSFPN